MVFVCCQQSGDLIHVDVHVVMYKALCSAAMRAVSAWYRSSRMAFAPVKVFHIAPSALQKMGPCQGIRHCEERQRRGNPWLPAGAALSSACLGGWNLFRTLSLRAARSAWAAICSTDELMVARARDVLGGDAGDEGGFLRGHGCCVNSGNGLPRCARNDGVCCARNDGAIVIARPAGPWRSMDSVSRVNRGYRGDACAHIQEDVDI